MALSSPLPTAVSNTAIADIAIRHGLVVDGRGSEPKLGDVAIVGDRIVDVFPEYNGKAHRDVDAAGLVVCPGFINMMSWSGQSLIYDPHSQSEIRQGVTLEVMGEGHSMGPLSPELRAEIREGNDLVVQNPHIPLEPEWTTLGEYLAWLEDRGVSTNVSSFVGAATVRIHVMGYERRRPTHDELVRMRSLVADAMSEGALGVASALIYAPGSYADAEELAALAEVAARHGGMYASHIRNESSRLLTGIGELIHIARKSGARAEVYHLKAGGEANWHLMDQAIANIESARAEGLSVTADMYPYTSAGTGLTSCLPPWVGEGGFGALLDRLADSSTRKRVISEMMVDDGGWDCIYVEAGPDNIVPMGFREEKLRQWTGKTLRIIAEGRNESPEETLLNLILEDRSRVFSLYPTMSEDNIRRQLQLPWMSFCSDSQSQAPHGAFLEMTPHPRAYGSFARILGRYVREEKVLPLAEAVRKMTSLPAMNLGLEDRGVLAPGNYADIVILDPETVADHASWSDPRRYATGVVHVLVNGNFVLDNGKHTGATPGRFVRGPGARR